MKKVLVFKLKNGIIIECEEGLIETKEAMFTIREKAGAIEHTKAYYVKDDNFYIKFLQNDIEHVSYKSEYKETYKDESLLDKGIYENKNHSLAELSINYLKELCELELKEMRKNK